MNDFVAGFSFVFDRWNNLLWDKTVEHIQVSVEAIALAIVIGVPVGVLLGHIHRFSFLAINFSNIGRALPSLGVLAILLPYTGIGQTTVVIALVILAAPPILTNSYVAVDQVDADTVDAARGLGLRPLQVLMKVELPLALPLIFAGIRTSAVFVVATATLSGFFGGGGLGDIISNPASFRIAGVIGAAYVLIALAFVVQLLFLGVEYLLTPVGLRQAKSGKNRSGIGRRSKTDDGADDGDDDGDDEGDVLSTSRLQQAQLKQAQLEQGSNTR